MLQDDLPLDHTSPLDRPSLRVCINPRLLSLHYLTSTSLLIYLTSNALPNRIYYLDITNLNHLKQELTAAIASSTVRIPLAGKEFKSLNKVKKFIKSRPEDQQYDLQVIATTLYMELKDRQDLELVLFYEWIEEEKAYEKSGATEDDFKKHFEDVAIVVANIKKTTLEIKAENVKRAIKRCKGERGKMMKKYLEMWAQETTYKTKHGPSR